MQRECGAGDGSGDPQEHGFEANTAGGAAVAPGSYQLPYMKIREKGHKAEADIVGLEDGQPA
jgi:hypothetical protein